MIMIRHMQQYYLDEKSGGIPALVSAVIFLMVGGLLLFRDSENSLSKGFGTGLLVVGLLIGIVGGASIVYNNGKLTELRKIAGENEGALRERELVRMERVMNVTFRNAFFTFAVVMVVALAVIVFGKSDYWRGVSLAVMLLVTLAIISDSYSMRRNALYRDAVMSFKF